MRAAYYNEHDPNAAAWLRELIRRGLLPAGEVDERSIEDVVPVDLARFGQCHFFAGIGVWPYALRLCGVPDDAPIWTGSCPCQPFSAAGKGKGFADERHLWPAWFHLIEQCGPAIVLGEQVSRRDGLAWLDLVSADLEGLGYACGAAPAPAAGFGAPHERERLYWLAHAAGQRHDWLDALLWQAARGWQPGHVLETAGRGAAGGVGDAYHAGPQGWGLGGHGADQCASRPAGLAFGLADADGRDASPERKQRSGDNRQQSRNVMAGAWPGIHGQDRPSDSRRSPGPLNGIWRDADWLHCRDAKWRPVEPGTFPLVDGAPARVVRLRGYGNGLVAPQAAAFVSAALHAVAEAAA